jgi:hypothetical protein
VKEKEEEKKKKKKKRCPVVIIDSRFTKITVINVPVIYDV